MTLAQPQNSGQWITFKNWNEVTTVAAENDSIVWAGTAVGLIRWNVVNQTYQTFDETNGLPFTHIHSIQFDRHGQLWISSKQGIARYAGGVFTLFNYRNSSLPSLNFTWVAANGPDMIYVGYEGYSSFTGNVNGGVAMFDGAHWAYHDIATSSGPYGPTALCICHDTLWVGEVDNLYAAVRSSFVPAPGWIGGGVVALAVDYQYSLWAEWVAFPPDSYKTIIYFEGQWEVIIDNAAWSIGEFWDAMWNDPRGGLWLTGYGSYRLDINMQRQLVQCSSGLPYGVCPVPELQGQINAQCALDATHQYFATPEGLVKFDGLTWEKILAPRNLYSNVVYSLGTSPAGDVYFVGALATQKTNGTYWDSIGGGGWINPEVRFNANGSLWTGSYWGRYVSSMDYDGFDAPWGVDGDILTYNGDGLTDWSSQSLGIRWPYSNPQFMSIAVDRNENIWATGWYGGSAMFDRTYWHGYFWSDTTLPNGNYDRVFADSRGRIWFGTNQSFPNLGFTVLQDGRWDTYSFPQNDWITCVFQIAEDHYGNIWLATMGGLLRYDGAKFTIFDTTNSGLQSNTVYAVTADLLGNIWAGTDAGLYVYNPVSVHFGAPAASSPVDSLTISPSGKYAVARFMLHQGLGAPAELDLQRGRSIRKFWTVRRSVISASGYAAATITDSSDILGDYYYRIKCIASDGTVSYSPAVPYSGGKGSAALGDSRWFLAENHVVFQWKTVNAAYVAGFDVLRLDSASGPGVITASISAGAPKSADGYYSLEGDTLRLVSRTVRYSLRAIFVDSTRISLRTFAIAPVYPDAFTVSNNYPNPFNGTTVVEIYLPAQGRLVVRIYDILGREVETPYDADFTSGFHRLQFDLHALASGVYVYEAKSSGHKLQGKLLLVK